MHARQSAHSPPCQTACTRQQLICESHQTQLLPLGISPGPVLPLMQLLIGEGVQAKLIRVGDHLHLCNTENKRHAMTFGP